MRAEADKLIVACLHGEFILARRALNVGACLAEDGWQADLFVFTLSCHTLVLHISLS